MQKRPPFGAFYVRLKDRELFAQIQRYCSQNNTSRSELGQQALREFFSQENEWQAVFKAVGRLQRRVEDLSRQTEALTELNLQQCKLLFAALGRDYEAQELAQVNKRSERAMEAFVKALQKALLDGGLYAPKLREGFLTEEN